MGFFRANNSEKKAEKLMLRGQDLFRRGKEEEAIRKFEQAALLLPNSSKPSLCLGKAHAKRKNFELALKHYYKALYFCDLLEEPHILYEIAWVYIRSHKFNLAEEKLLKILDLNNHLESTWSGLGYVYQITGRLSKAIEAQTKALELRGQDLNNLLDLARTYQILGENQKASDLLKIALPLAEKSDYWREEISLQLKETEFQDGTEPGIKDTLYVEDEIICLGGDQDDGIKVPAYQDYTIQYTDLARVLQRFLTFKRVFKWNITCTVFQDKESLSLATALGYLLEVPVKTIYKVQSSDLPLLCYILFQDTNGLSIALHKLKKKSKNVISFTAAILLSTVRNQPLPDILGIPIMKETSLPWNGHLVDGDLTPSLQTDISQNILTALYNIVEDPNLEAQISYYFLNHVHIRKHLRPNLTTRNPSDITKALTREMDEETIIKNLSSHNKGKILSVIGCIRGQHLQSPKVIVSLKKAYIENQEPIVRDFLGKLLMSVQDDEGLDFLIKVFQSPRQIQEEFPLKKAAIKEIITSNNRRVADIIYQALKDSDEEIRYLATQGLDKLESSAKTTQLVLQLLKDSPRICCEALRYLGKNEPEILLDYLPSLLKYEHPAVIYETLSVIRNLEVETKRVAHLLPQLVELLTHPDLNLVREAIGVIGTIGDVDSGRYLLPLLEHVNPEIKKAVFTSLVKINGKGATLFLLEWLKKEVPEIKGKIIELLGEAGSEEVTQSVIECVEENLENLGLRLAVIRYLKKFKDRKSFPFIQKMLKMEKNEEALITMIEILEEIGEEENMDLLIPLLTSSPKVQFKAAGVLYKKGKTEYFEILKDGIRSKKLSVNLEAIKILGEIGDSRSLEKLFEAFKKRDIRLDEPIVEILYKHKDAATLLPLVREITEADREPQKAGVEEARPDPVEGIMRVAQCGTLRETSYKALLMLEQFIGNKVMKVVKDLLKPGVDYKLKCNALRFLSKHKAEQNRRLIEQMLEDENIYVVNTARKLLMQ
jgi:HEAT repeat protein/tetratricopeptide (TPR) repeat protein